MYENILLVWKLLTGEGGAKSQIFNHLKLVRLGCGKMGYFHDGCADDKSAETVMLSCQYVEKHLRGMFPAPC